MNINNEIKEKIYYMIGVILAVTILGCALSLISWLGNATVNQLFI
jgi:hypothetical protein